MIARDTTEAHRLAWLDYAKGIGIILVVLGHANQGIGGHDMALYPVSQHILNDLIYSFHMPLFFALAGYAASLAHGKDLASQARSMLWGIVIPYVVWSAVWISAKATLPVTTSTEIGIEGLASMLWAPVEQFWFLYELFFVRLLWYGIEKLASGNAALALIAVALVVAVGLRSTGSEATTAPYFLENASTYGLGLIVLPAALTWLGERRSWLTLGLVMTPIWLAVALLLWRTDDVRLIAPAALAGTAAAIAAARVLPEPRTPPLKLLALLGEASLAIYLLHLFATALTRWVVFATGALGSEALLVLSTVLGLLVPLAVHLAVLKAGQVTGTPLLRWLALGQGRNSHYVDLGEHGPKVHSPPH